MTTPGSDRDMWSAPSPPPGQQVPPPAQGWPAPSPYGPPGSGPQGFGPQVYGTPFGTPAAPPRPPRGDLAHRGDVVAAVVAGGVMLLAGVPLGLLWGATLRTVDVADLLTNSSESALEAQPAADARFALIAAVFGLVAGLVAAWRGRRAGWPLPVGLVLGGVGGSLLAAQIGHLLKSQSVLDTVPPTAKPLVRELVDVTVRADGVHAVFPLVAALVFLALMALTTRAEPLQVSDEPDAGAWWSSPR